MTVRVDGEEPIPEHKWYQISDILTRQDEMLALMSKQIDLTNTLLRQLIEIMGYIPSPPPPPTIPSQVSIIPNNRYKTHTVDLSVVHTDKELSLGVTANHAVVLKCDSACQWKRNNKANDLEDLSVGYSIDDFALTELYITNTAAAGELKILVEWRE